MGPATANNIGELISPSWTMIYTLFLLMLDFSLFGGAESLYEDEPFSSVPSKHQGVQLPPPRTVVVNAPNSRDHVKAPQDPADFLWLMTEEPHRTRRMEILKAHPEVRL